ncbi:MAG: mechanosensitive ion channel [Myxococcales bacterium]|nr:mechanosensitive ion channel [Myxococcales bacterium]
MEELFGIAAWREILVRAFSELGADLARFLPNLVGAVLILLVGWVLSRAVEVVASRGLRTVGLDGAAARLEIADLLQRADIHLTFSQIVAKLLFWLVMLTFVLSSVETLGLSAVTATIDRLIAFIPNVIGAALIAIGGLLLGRFVSALVSSGAVAAGLESAPRLGFLAQMAVVSLMLVLAAEQLGIATSILVLPLTVLLAAAGFAVGLAFALGARPVITHIMAGHFLKQSLPRDVAIEIDGQRGMVERVGAVDTLLRGDDRAWTVPNARLLGRVVLR